MNGQKGASHPNHGGIRTVTQVPRPTATDPSAPSQCNSSLNVPATSGPPACSGTWLHQGPPLEKRDPLRSRSQHLRT